jgi:hypothetical protein
LTKTLRGSARSTILFFVLLLAADVLVVVVTAVEEEEEFLVRSMRKGGEICLFGSMGCDESDLDSKRRAGGDRARWSDSGRGEGRGVAKIDKLAWRTSEESVSINGIFHSRSTELKVRFNQYRHNL